MRLSNGDVLFAWPLDNHIVTAGWTYNDGSAHNAIDLRAALKTPVYAAEDGTVNWVQHWDWHTLTGDQSYNEFADRVSFEQLDLICEALDCSISDLLEYIPNAQRRTGKDLIRDKKSNLNKV